MSQPDLKVKEGAIDFLEFKSPTKASKPRHDVVNAVFTGVIEDLWDYLPDGPGKTVFVRKLQEARMAANCCIANEGA